MCVDTIIINKLPAFMLMSVLLAFSFQAQSLSDKAVEMPTKKTIQLAIIIDDIGAKASDAEAFSLSKSITFSILPHTDFSTDFSYRASQQNREVMLHMPMESLHKENLGPGPLLPICSLNKLPVHY